MLEEGQRYYSCIPLRNILNSYTQQVAGVSRNFSQLFCIANVTFLEDSFPMTRWKQWTWRGEGISTAKRQLLDHPGKQHRGATRWKEIWGVRSQNAPILKYEGERTHRKVRCLKESVIWGLFMFLHVFSWYVCRKSWQNIYIWFC